MDVVDFLVCVRPFSYMHTHTHTLVHRHAPVMLCFLDVPFACSIVRAIARSTTFWKDIAISCFPYDVACDC